MYETPRVKFALGGRGGVGMFPTKAPTSRLDCAFPNTKRAEKVPKPDLGVIILRWRVGLRVFGRLGSPPLNPPSNKTHASTKVW